MPLLYGIARGDCLYLFCFCASLPHMSILSGVVKGDTLFREREYPPFTHSRTVRESSSCTSAGKKLFYASGVKIPFSVTSIVQRISCSSTGTSGDMSCSRQMSTVGQWSCGSRRS